MYLWPGIKVLMQPAGFCGFGFYMEGTAIGNRPNNAEGYIGTLRGKIICGLLATGLWVPILLSLQIKL